MKDKIIKTAKITAMAMTGYYALGLLGMAIIKIRHIIRCRNGYYEKEMKRA